MKLLRIIALILTFAVTLIVIQLLSSGGVAPIPEVFNNGLSLDAAIDRARAEKKPVLVYATADWCGPCQVMKRTVLSEASVAKAIAADFVPAYVDIDKDRAAAERLKIFSIPATIVLWDGKLVAQMEGVYPNDVYSNWLAAARDQALSNTPFVERASDEFLRNLNQKIEAQEAIESGNSPSKPAPARPAPPPR